MTSPRRRRVVPIRRPSPPPRKRRIRKPVRVDWKGRSLRVLIALFCMIDVVLVLFAFRQCSVPIQETIEPEVPVEKRILQIEVLNGCGVDGVADKFTRYLRQQELDVVKTDNYGTIKGEPNYNVLETVIIERQGVLENGVQIAQALGLKADRVLQEVNATYLIDATVIIGKDFRRLEAWKAMEQ